MPDVLQQIADMLLLNGTLVECPGLIHGKTGIAIFFFRYARQTETELFEDYAMALIGEIQSQIHNTGPADYERGIAGIGMGIDYLIHNKYLEAGVDIFEDFDQRMYRAVMYDPWPDFSLYDGLAGYGRYWMMRLCQPSSAEKARECLLQITDRIKEKLPDISGQEYTDVYCFLHDLHSVPGFDHCTELLNRCRHRDLQPADIDRYFPRLGDSSAGNIIRMYQYRHYFGNVLQDEIDAALKRIPDWDAEKQPPGMGLLTGYAGEGMLRLTALDTVAQKLFRRHGSMVFHDHQLPQTAVAIFRMAQHQPRNADVRLDRAARHCRRRMVGNRFCEESLRKKLSHVDICADVGFYFVAVFVISTKKCRKFCCDNHIALYRNVFFREKV